MRIIYSIYIYILLCFYASADDTLNLSKTIFETYAAAYQPQEKAFEQPNETLINLGEKIFFDTRFSNTGKMSCSTCHIPEKSFSDNHKTAMSNQGKHLKRKTMTLYHIEDDDMFFWDGRENSLEKQFFEAFQNPLEMNFSFSKAISLMQKDIEYQDLFNQLQLSATKYTMAKAVVAYEKSIAIPPKTQFDAWLAGDLTALIVEQLKGFEIFNTKADCIACHMGNKFKDGLRNDIGLPDTDLGYGEITKQENDFHTFKTPTLRGIAQRSPYMHDGSLKTLEDVIEHYNIQEFKRGDTDIPPEEAQGNIIAFHNFTQPLNLTEQEKKYLIEFLKIL